MATNFLGYPSLTHLPIEDGAVTPDPGKAGVIAWSTTLNKPVYWNGSLWSTALTSDMAETISAVKPVPVDADTVILIDSQDSNRPKLTEIGNIRGTSAPPVTVSHNGADTNPHTGDTLTAAFAPRWLGDIRWERNFSPIPGETSLSYVVAEDDIGNYVAPTVRNLVYSPPGFVVDGDIPVPTEPGTFLIGQWSLAARPLSALVDILTLPANGGSPITALQYRIDGGSPVTFSGTGTGQRTITGLIEDVEIDLQIRAVNAIGAGEWSDTKQVTPTASTGGGAATWEAVTLTSMRFDNDPRPIAVPPGGTAEQTLVLQITGVLEDTENTISIPAGWTRRHFYWNLDGFGLGPGGAQGVAVYTAPGNNPGGSWSVPNRVLECDFEVHLWSNVDQTTPVSLPVAVNDANTWGTGPNMPSPSVTPNEGDGIMAYTFLPQNDGARIGTPTAGYTVAVDNGNPGRHCTLVRSNVPAGATGEILHGTAGDWQARISHTLLLNAG